jgi:hypothetical protein
MSEGALTAAAQACNACADACDHCLSQCLLLPDVQPMTHCIALDLECAALCRLMAGYAMRGSKFAPQLAAVCRQVCEACGKECAQHDHDHCQQCAAACRQCAEACRRLASLEAGKSG